MCISNYAVYLWHGFIGFDPPENAKVQPQRTREAYREAGTCVLCVRLLFRTLKGGKTDLKWPIHQTERGNICYLDAHASICAGKLYPSSEKFQHCLILILVVGNLNKAGSKYVIGGYVVTWLCAGNCAVLQPILFIQRPALGWVFLLLLTRNAKANWFCYRLVCVSVNRLTLHLRTYAVDSNTLPHDAGRTTNSRRRRSSWLGASTLDVDDTIMSSDGGRDMYTLEMHGLSSDDGTCPKIYYLNGNALCCLRRQ